MCAVGVDGDEVARGPDAATLLDSTDTRNKIVDELMEVRYLYNWPISSACLLAAK